MVLNILLVEDEVLVSMMAEEELTALGYSVTAVANGDRAFEVIERGETFDVLVTDIRMPGAIDGWELARRARSSLPDIRVVYTSGFTDAHAPVEGSIYIKKPYRIALLAESVLGRDQ